MDRRMLFVIRSNFFELHLVGSTSRLPILPRCFGLGSPVDRKHPNVQYPIGSKINKGKENEIVLINTIKCDNHTIWPKINTAQSNTFVENYESALYSVENLLKVICDVTKCFAEVFSSATRPLNLPQIMVNYRINS